MKLPLPCPKCGKDVIMQRLRPVHDQPKQILVPNAPLTAYHYDCPKCGTKSTFNKDYVREVWEQRNPGKSFVRIIK